MVERDLAKVEVAGSKPVSRSTQGLMKKEALRLILAATALLVVLAACGGDSNAGATSDTSPTAAATTPAPTSSPASNAVIPNLTQDAALQLYVDGGLNCTVVQPTHAGWTRHRCSKTEGGGEATVDFEGPGTAVATLKAATIGLPDTIAQGFVSDSATLPFDGAASDQAQQWVSDSWPKGGGTTVIGGVHLQLLSNPPVASVTLKPAA